MQIIKKDSIEHALSKEYRQYLTGHLSKSQPFLNHIDDDIEIGISHYSKFTADKPHYHPVCTEHAYVLEGAIKICLLDGSNEEFEIKEGDFFVIRPGIPYAAKNAKGTKVLFIKSPGTNDKTLIEVDDKTKTWLSTW